MCTPSRSIHREAGFSLIELVITIVIIGVGLAGLLGVLNLTTQHSADPMLHKQALAIAESLLTEIEQQAFTYCDPQDPNVLTAAGAAGCTGGAAASQDKGGAGLTSPTPASETRYSAIDPFDNVADYGGFNKTNVDDILGNNAMNGYAAAVTVTRAGTTFSLPNDAVLKIEVRVTGRGDDITLTGYRFRYAPNSAG